MNRKTLAILVLAVAALFMMGCGQRRAATQATATAQAVATTTQTPVALTATAVAQNNANATATAVAHVNATSTAQAQAQQTQTANTNAAASTAVAAAQATNTAGQATITALINRPPQQAAPVPGTPIPSAAPTTTNPSASSPVAGQTVCNPLAITSLGQKELAVVNDTIVVRLETRDVNSCVRGLFNFTTGNNATTIFKVDLKQGASLQIPAVGVTITKGANVLNRMKDSQGQNLCPYLVVRGPQMLDKVEVFEGEPRLFPSQWEADGVNLVYPIHKEQCKKAGPPEYLNP